jgi:hypothetical protein
VPDVFQLSVYTPHEGKLDALLARFRDHTVRLLARHHVQSVGYWLSEVSGEPTRLVYLLRHDSREAAEANWAAFGADPEWVAAYQASMHDGPLVADIQKSFLDPTDFSPLQ